MATTAQEVVERREQLTDRGIPIDRQKTALTKSRYDRNAASYDKRMAMMERVALRRLRHRLWSLVGQGRVLEVGVGTGNSMPFYPSGAQVTGIDLSDQMLIPARQRAEREGVAVDLREMDAQDLKFAEGTFDSAVSTCVFCSVPDPVLGLREVRRVLKPGGKLIMLEHVRGPGLLGPLFDLLNPVVLQFNGANINRHTVENVRLAGFEIERVDSYMLGIVKLIVARRGHAA